MTAGLPLSRCPISGAGWESFLAEADQLGDTMADTANTAYSFCSMTGATAKITKKHMARSKRLNVPSQEKTS
jgi:putative hemolysin